MKKGLSFAVITLFIGIALAPSITASEPTSNQTVYSDENGTLSGYVKDTSMNPIEGAIIRASCGENYFENVSDSSGYYYIDNIPIVFCLWNISASKKGYKTIWVETSIGENTTLDFVLTPLGKTLYVGGSGAGNYTTIQSAIDDANSGDTVFVYNGSYRENININKPLFLTGEDNNSTIIFGFGADEQIVSISADNVTINNFLILNSFVPFLKYEYIIYLYNVKNVSICSNNFISDNDDIWSYIMLDDVSYCTIKKNYLNGSSSEEHVINLFGIRLKNSDNNIISENIIKFHWESSISLKDSNNNIITNNSILNARWGIELYYSDKNIIRRNIIGFNEYAGIDLFNSSKNLILENIISRNGVYGITLFESPRNNITKNNIVSNDVCGIDICSNGFIYNLFFSGKPNRTASLWNTISNNNFIDNTKHASFQSSYCTNWKMNYWGQTRTKPYPIYGQIEPFYKIAIPWIQFDWNPAKEPYDIPIPKVP